MSGYSASLVPNRYLAGEDSVLFLPRKVNPAKRAVIYAHGANGNGAQAVNATSQRGITQAMAAIAQSGLVVLSGDWGGLQTYGNDIELAAMEAGWAWLQTSGLCATDKVILTGGSMGMLSTSRFAAEHPTWVAGLNCWIPAIDIDGVRDSNALGLRDLVNTAWGLPAGSYPALDGSSVPIRGRPLARLAAVADIPTHLWYSSGDTATTAAAVDAYAAGRPNVTKHLVSTTLDHSDAAILASDTPTIVDFLKTVA